LEKTKTVWGILNELLWLIITESKILIAVQHIKLKLICLPYGFRMICRLSKTNRIPANDYTTILHSSQLFSTFFPLFPNYSNHQ